MLLRVKWCLGWNGIKVVLSGYGYDGFYLSTSIPFEENGSCFLVNSAEGGEGGGRLIMDSDYLRMPGGDVVSGFLFIAGGRGFWGCGALVLALTSVVRVVMMGVWKLA